MQSASRTFLNALKTTKLTERDMDILVLLYYRRLLTGSQIAEILFTTCNPKSRYMKAMQRLKVLEQLGLVNSLNYSKKIFVLNRAGEYGVASRLGCAISELRYLQKESIIMQNIEHYLRTNDIGVAMEKIGKVNKFIVGVKYELKKTNVLPDAVISLEHKKKADFYLEVDRGTQTISQFLKKIPRYEALYSSKKYLEEFSKFPYVLIMTEKRTRIDELKKRIEKESKSDITYMLCCIEDFILSPNQEIFVVPNKTKQYSILQTGI